MPSMGYSSSSSLTALSRCSWEPLMRLYDDMWNRFFSFIVCFFFGVLPSIVLAQTPQKPSQPAYGLKDPLVGKTIPDVLSSVVRFGLGFIGALFLAYFIYGGILWMTAGGNG